MVPVPVASKPFKELRTSLEDVRPLLNLVTVRLMLSGGSDRLGGSHHPGAGGARPPPADLSRSRSFGTDVEEQLVPHHPLSVVQPVGLTHPDTLDVELPTALPANRADLALDHTTRPRVPAPHRRPARQRPSAGPFDPLLLCGRTLNRW